ncbi:MAG: FAD-dependent oxidoreductase [Sphingomonas phyllosphaerae]
MTSTTAAGTAIAISAGTLTSFDAAGFAALTYTDVGGVDKIGPIGATFGKVEFQPLKGPKDKQKSTPDYGALSLSMAYDELDAGQSLLRAAGDDDTQRLYPVRVTYPTGAIRYFRTRVFGTPESVDGAESVLMTNAVVEICSKPVKVAGSGTPAPTPTPTPSVTLVDLGLSSLAFQRGVAKSVDITNASAAGVLTGSTLPTGFTVASSARKLAYDGSGSGASTLALAIAETNANAAGSRTTTFSLTMAAAAATPTFGALSLSDANFQRGVAKTVDILGATAGSTIVVNNLPTSFTLNSAARTLSYNGAGSGATSVTLSVDESGSGYTTRNSQLTITLAAASGGLPAFTTQSETTTAVSNFTTPATVGQVRAMDKAIRLFKKEGIWSKIKVFGTVGADAQQTAINWKTGAALATTGPLVVTTPFEAITPGTAALIRSGVLMSDLDPTNATIGSYSKQTTSMVANIGAKNADGNMFSVSPKVATDGVGKGGIGSPETLFTGALTEYDGAGWQAVTRLPADGNNMRAYRFGAPKGVLASAPAAAASLGATELYIGGYNNNGTAVSSGRRIFAWLIAEGLTDKQMVALGYIVEGLSDSLRYGEYNEIPAGMGATTVSSDAVFYGVTPMSMVGAWEAKRQGLNPIIVGGWRERRPGGMSSGGLGFTDFLTQSALQGLPRWMLAQLQTMDGQGTNVFQFNPKTFDKLTRSMFDPRFSFGYDIPIYYSDGIAAGGVTKTGTRVTKIVTRDGRTINCTGYVADGSYEGDLARQTPGVTTVYGREAATGTSAELKNGERGLLQDAGGNGHQFRNKADNSFVKVDPWVVPGDTTSGLLPNVNRIYVAGNPANGAADNKVQAFNFRSTFTSGDLYRRPFPFSAGNPPTGYNKQFYEALGRFLAISPTSVLADLMKNDPLPGVGGVSDINAKNGFSTDFFAKNWGYLEGTNAQREAIWKDIWNKTMGFWYYLQYENDPRISTAIRTEALKWGLSMIHYTDPHPNDDYGYIPQLYVREGFRLVGDLIVTGDDAQRTDGTTPTSIKTVAVASYDVDSHHVETVAENVGGTWGMWNTGNVQASQGGADGVQPIPYEAIVPKASECTNMFCLFGISATHIGISSYRMEFTGMLAGQSAAHAMKVAKAASAQDVQSVDYSTLRSSILNAMTLTGETAQLLPQVN